MKVKKFYLNEQEINQISVALTLYVHTFEKCGIGLDSMPTVASLIEQFNSKL